MNLNEQTPDALQGYFPGNLPAGIYHKTPVIYKKKPAETVCTKMNWYPQIFIFCHNSRLLAPCSY
jgi:hypothetical protein